MIERPTHRNTTFDQAKFEVCGHQFADLSEVGYGITMASSDKYGWSVESNTMRSAQCCRSDSLTDLMARLTLLRAPTSPDPLADRGLHSFKFAVMPHSGRFADGDVLTKVRAFTSPVLCRFLNRFAGKELNLVSETLARRREHPSTPVIRGVQPPCPQCRPREYQAGRRLRRRERASVSDSPDVRIQRSSHQCFPENVSSKWCWA